MNNLMNSLKKFFKNKNTVTILGVIAVLVLLYWGYSREIKAAVNPVTVPIAAQTIPARTQITADMVSSMEVSSIAVTENVYTSANAVIGKYTNVNTIVPSGSLFYREAVVDSNDFRDSIFENLDDDEIPYLFSVDIESTYGNSIYPGTTVDVYMKALDEANRVIVGRLLEDVTVLAVRDSDGNDVFADSSALGTPEYLLFALTEEIHLLMRKADFISSGGIELFPVIHGGSYSTEGGETRVSTEYLKDYINAKSVILEGQESNNTTEDNEATEETVKTEDSKKKN